MRFMRLPEVTTFTGLSRTTLWRMERAGQFPRRRLISPGSVAWVEAEIHEWANARIADGRRLASEGGR